MKFDLDVGNLPACEYSPDFLQGMMNRMAVSHHKYGHIHPSFPVSMDAVACLRLRLEKYEADGNTEWLMDVANYAMIEFLCPKHPDAHFRATSSEESPGRVTADGRVTTATKDAYSFHRHEGD